MNTIPKCPCEDPKDIAKLIYGLGNIWSGNEVCPQINVEIKSRWDELLREWMDDLSVPLLIRKSSYVKGSVVVHSTDRKIVPTDNSPAQWACHLALQGIVPEISDVRDFFEKDTLPVALANKKQEKEKRTYHCTLRKFSTAGWKLCHITPVGLNTRTPLSNIDISSLKNAFFNLLSPSNYFLLPKRWGGLGEVPEFIEGYQHARKSF